MCNRKRVSWLVGCPVCQLMGLELQVTRCEFINKK